MYATTGKPHDVTRERLPQKVPHHPTGATCDRRPLCVSVTKGERAMHR